jgi:hypothetical protein
MSTLELRFLGFGDDVSLSEVSFCASPGHTPILSMRGSGIGHTGYNLFPWTKAVRALAVLFLKTAICRKSRLQRILVPPRETFLAGERGSLASSLDYALSKQPIWLADMFGVDTNGVTLAKRFITRTNSERKRPGPVTLSVRDSSTLSISIILNERLLEDVDGLLSLIAALGAGDRNFDQQKALFDDACHALKLDPPFRPDTPLSAVLEP